MELTFIRNVIVPTMCEAFEQSGRAREDACDCANELQNSSNPLIMHETIESAHGASKEVLIFPTRGYALKWSDRSRDCEREAAIYTEAVKQGLEQFFPETVKVAEWTDPRTGQIITIIAQQIVDCDTRTISHQLNRKLLKIINTVPDIRHRQMDKAFKKADLNGYGRDLSIIWSKVVVSLYGKRKAIALCNFVKQFHINDLHRSNLGYIGIKPVLIDFSGYNVNDDFQF